MRTTVRTVRSGGLAIVAALLAVTYPAAQARPKIVIVATGGTIAGSADSTTAAGYQSGAVAVDVLINAVPQMKKFADVSGVQVASIGSQDMNDEVWVKLATEVNAILAKPDVTGVAITHGTDTMEETAYFLNLVVKSDEPVVMVGSMRPSTAVSADGPLNLYNAIAVAADPAAKARGVLVVMNDWIHLAHSLTRTSTTAVQTFLSPVRGLGGIVAYGKTDWYNIPAWKHTTRSEFDISRVNALPRVDIVYAYADMPADAIDSAVKNGAKGIVIAGVGNGNFNKAYMDAVKRAVAAGVIVCRASRAPSGRVVLHDEINDEELGTIVSDDLTPQKARVLLMLALTRSKDKKQLQEVFFTY